MNFEEFVDENGEKNIILSKITIKGVDYYLTRDRKAFTKEDGKYKRFDMNSNAILSKIMEPPKSLDVVKTPEDNEKNDF